MNVYDWESAINYVLTNNNIYVHSKCILRFSDRFIYIKDNDGILIKRLPENALRYLNDKFIF